MSQLVNFEQSIFLPLLSLMGSYTPCGRFRLRELTRAHDETIAIVWVRVWGCDVAGGLRREQENLRTPL
jgi:hypothetical protein